MGDNTFMNYKLTPRQHALINYLLPCTASLTLYVILIASECALVFRHFKDNNDEWAYITIFLIFLPSLGSYILTISQWDLWPKMYGCDTVNCFWFIRKTLEHLMFPIWAIWRFAEQIFWSIEAVRWGDEKLLTTVSAPRSIELYFFLQGFLHSLPQIMLQMNILMKQDYKVNKQTADAEILSLVFNLTRLAATVTEYQRFKSQKMLGKQYPWYKYHKQAPPLDRNLLQQHRRSSDFYLSPTIDDEPDFNIRRTIAIKGLPEDDLAGKIASFLWWFCFLIVRILAISTFFYFYRMPTIYLILAHFVLVLALLIYDVKSDEVQRAKAAFFIFIGFVYIFCIIEFKIRFKKAKMMYLVFFIIVTVENFTMCLIWWTQNVDELEQLFWFRFCFVVIVMGSILSVTALLLYWNVFKPKKIVIERRFK